MTWVQIEFDASPGSAQSLSESLQEAGALAVTLQDGAEEPIFEPHPGTTPLWHITRVTGLFEAGLDMERLIDALQARLAPEPVPPHQIRELRDQVWERVCMDQFRPMRFGERLWVCPHWSTPPDPAAVNLRLDPGLAFGTGTHPTTRLCLEWLGRRRVVGSQLIDYGCGSGILAIAGLLLGAVHAWAVDTDPQALTATRQNARENRVAERLSAVPPKALPDIQADVLLANILAQPLTELAPTLAGHLGCGARIALSGILREQVAAIVEAYRPWVQVDPVTYRGDWALVTGRRLREPGA